MPQSFSTISKLCPPWFRVSLVPVSLWIFPELLQSWFSKLSLIFQKFCGWTGPWSYLHCHFCWSHSVCDFFTSHLYGQCLDVPGLFLFLFCFFLIYLFFLVWDFLFVGTYFFFSIPSSLFYTLSKSHIVSAKGCSRSYRNSSHSNWYIFFYFEVNEDCCIFCF